ncbi:hypothetical protein AXG93_3932s1110 [Marchantia polymorpha subsp. ruderalis]|uniref:Uncharacterized protein n=1 Tax=Marchantia polymorpha subsp. ruderalis TaxID=1480154 RepID=A0A176VIJ0_MARPO|nr:hypothetical protein AXG93_3932s1110 [Marchantia polymorpha subsp. ruderalis]
MRMFRLSGAAKTEGIRADSKQNRDGDRFGDDWITRANSGSGREICANLRESALISAGKARSDVRDGAEPGVGVAPSVVTWRGRAWPTERGHTPSDLGANDTERGRSPLAGVLAMAVDRRKRSRSRMKAQLALFAGAGRGSPGQGSEQKPGGARVPRARPDLARPWVRGREAERE